jgi:hypothetical protein
VGKGFDSSYITTSFRGALSVRLVIEGTIEIIVPLIVSFLLNALSLLAPVFDPSADDVMQVSVILITLLAAPLRWSEAASQVPMWTLLVVKFLTLDSIVAVMNWVHHGC